MTKQPKEESEGGVAKRLPASTEIAQRGINTDADFAAVFTALIGDTLSGAINPNVTNAACNSAGKLLKMFELRQKYGTQPGALRFAEAVTSSTTTPDAKALAMAKLSVEERKLLGLGE